MNTEMIDFEKKYIRFLGRQSKKLDKKQRDFFDKTATWLIKNSPVHSTVTFRKNEDNELHIDFTVFNSESYVIHQSDFYSSRDLGVLEVQFSELKKQILTKNINANRNPKKEL